ncbi:UNVERIFIED_CONTAM: hypothetical protein Slati_2091800 [Sesamum latifolium]|uniref:Uncharacterized protein n=1 Tax=Sesamum latifolium TaxID=2727402 RepID=A0AAW2WQZ8_9LAMI
MADSTESHIPETAKVKREGLVQPGRQFALIESDGQQGLEKGTNLQGDPISMDDHLVAVPVVFCASVTRGSGRRRKGMRGAGRRGLTTRKRGLVFDLFEIGEGEDRAPKRRHLLNEDSDIISTEAAMQPCRSP